ncbi:MAG: MerR family transcriptional regulator [Steroidobacteraceae bacterium]|nr:MerR family transcriptional regulator [Steroidobacteraceae bacterium]MDW8258000.1 MerR family transcriptional regulator [Gammaproteobacteria bacterium]
MTDFSIKAVSQATGLTVETLRAWERRYEVVLPKRDASGRRSYSASDVARLRLLRAATELGHPISRLARLSPDELAALVNSAGGHARAAVRGQSYVERALDAAEHSDPTGVEETLLAAISLLTPSEVANTVIAPLVREVGERWHRGELTIAQEHMVTDIVRRLIVSATRGVIRSENAPCLVLATLSGERHELGILLCCWLAAARRFRTHYLGADLPAAEIARFAAEVEAYAVLVSLVMPEHETRSLEQLDALMRLLRPRSQVWLGGQAAAQLMPAQVPDGAVLLPTLRDFEQRLDLIVN